MNSGYSEPPDIVNFLPGPFEFTLTRVHCMCMHMKIFSYICDRPREKGPFVVK